MGQALQSVGVACLLTLHLHPCTAEYKCSLPVGVACLNYTYTHALQGQQFFNPAGPSGALQEEDEETPGYCYKDQDGSSTKIQGAQKIRLYLNG